MLSTWCEYWNRIMRWWMIRREKHTTDLPSSGITLSAPVKYLSPATLKTYFSISSTCARQDHRISIWKGRAWNGPAGRLRSPHKRRPLKGPTGCCMTPILCKGGEQYLIKGIEHHWKEAVSPNGTNKQVDISSTWRFFLAGAPATQNGHLWVHRNFH